MCKEPDSKVAALSDKQLDILAHTLGLDNAPEAYRNYYVSPLDADCEALVAHGYMERHERSRIPEGYVYVTTGAGRAALKQLRPSKFRKWVYSVSGESWESTVFAETRNKARYQAAFILVDSDYAENILHAFKVLRIRRGTVDDND